MVNEEDYEKLQRALADVLSSHVHGGESDEILAELDSELQERGLLQPPEDSKPLDFAGFWKLYDKSVERQKAEALWARLSKRDRAAAMAYIPKYKAAQPDKRFRKNPATFLRNRTWEDEIINTQATSRPNDTVMQERDANFDNMETW